MTVWIRIPAACREWADGLLGRAAVEDQAVGRAAEWATAGPGQDCHCCGCSLDPDTPVGACPDCESLQVGICDSCAQWCMHRGPWRGTGGACGSCLDYYATEEKRARQAADRQDYIMESSARSMYGHRANRANR